MTIVGVLSLLGVVAVAVLFARSAPFAPRGVHTVPVRVVAYTDGDVGRSTTVFHSRDEQIPAAVLDLDDVELPERNYEAVWYTTSGTRLARMSGRGETRFRQPLPAGDRHPKRGRLTFTFGATSNGRFVEILARTRVEVVYP